LQVAAESDEFGERHIRDRQRKATAAGQELDSHIGDMRTLLRQTSGSQMLHVKFHKAKPLEDVIFTRGFSDSV